MLVEINLLPKKEPKNYALLAIIAAALLLFLAAGVFILWQGNSLQNQLTRLDDQIAATKKMTEAEQVKLGSDSASNSVAELEAAVKWAKDEPVKAVPIIQKVTALLPYRGFIQNISYTETGAVTLTVQFDTNRDAAYYLKTLLDAKWISDVKLTTLATSEENANSTTESTGSKLGDGQIIIPRYIGQFQITLDRDFINKQEKAENSKESNEGGDGS